MGSELDRCLKAAEKPYDYLADLKKRTGKPMAGFLSSYIPHEVVYAAGAHPFRVFPSEYSFNRSYGYLQPFACSYVRAALEDGLEGRLSFADCLLFSHTCDTLQTVEGIWRRTVNIPVAANLNFPTVTGGALPLNFLINQLKDFYGALSLRFNENDENNLMKVCRLYGENRALLRELYGLRREGRLSLTSSDFYKILNSSFFMDIIEHSQCLKAIIRESSGKPAERRGARLFLSGCFFTFYDILKGIDELGGTVIEDDLCVGRREVFREANGELPPLRALAEGFLNKAACPCKYHPEKERFERFVSLVKNSRASGVVFANLKFCEPHLFEVPLMMERLKREEIPAISLELEHKEGFSGQLRTRIQAFIEMLSS